MNSILYLWKTTLKNMFLDLKRKPAKLILYILILILLGFLLLSGSFAPDTEDSYRDLAELGTVIFIFFLFLFCTGIYRGFSSGASFFFMNDVNLLFTAPISPKKILGFGLIRQLGSSIILAFFLLFQAGWIRANYGVSSLDILYIFFAYIFLTFLSQTAAMVIYTFVSKSDRRKKILKFIFFFTIAVPVFYVIYQTIKSSGSPEAVMKILNGDALEFFPVAGWLKGIVFSLINHSGLTVSVFLYTFLTIAFITLLFLSIARSKADYFEDVLQNAEKTSAAQQAAKEGRIADTKDSTKIKIRRYGIHRGFGASVLFFKHLIENKRLGFLYLDMMSFISIVSGIIFSIAMGKNGNLIITFYFLTYMQVFLSLTGRWTKELTLPYIYLIPENPFKKLIYACIEDLLKSIIDGAIIFIPLGLFIFKASPLLIVICIMARFGFALLFLAGNILSEKLLGGMINKGLLVFLYFFIMLLLTLPGIVSGALIETLWGANAWEGIMLFSTFIWNITISVLIFFLCRNILHHMETTGK